METTAPILAAVDFSPHARHAAMRAAQIAQHRGAGLALLHVLPEAPLAQLREWLGGSATPEAQLLADARGHLAELVATLPDTGAAVQAQVEVGAPIELILRRAEQLGAGLLTLGSRGNSLLRRLALGSTAERLLRRSPRPLLVVRQLPHEPYRRVLVAVDFSPWSAGAVALARAVAPQARLLLMSVFEVPFEQKLRFAGIDDATIGLYRQRVRAEATRRLHELAGACALAPSAWEPVVVDGDAALRLVEVEEQRDCDLVVLGKHGVSAAVDLLLGSTTRHVLAEGSVDVLVSTARAA